MAKLYIVPTPIGNLDDITIRAVRVLSEVDFILAEDTRTSSVLLKHLGIEKKMYAHHKFNEHATVGLVADNIAQGRSAALISDAGTPGISTLHAFSKRGKVLRKFSVPCLFYNIFILYPFHRMSALILFLVSGIS